MTSTEKALQAIAAMKITETTDTAQLAALCIAIARTELAKIEVADYQTRQQQFLDQWMST